MLTAEFKRKFSVSMHKNKKIMLAEMSFYKNFTDESTGCLYPLIQKEETGTEVLYNNTYASENGFSKRLFCQFFPFASYEIEADVQNGFAGFEFNLGGNVVSVVAKGSELIYNGENGIEKIGVDGMDSSRVCMIISCRPGAFDVYFKRDGYAVFFRTFTEKNFENSNEHKLFKNSYVYMYSMDSKVFSVSSYIDNGVGIGDIRPLKYENGEIFSENGKVYFTASIRMQEETIQGVFSWVPATACIELTGAVFYDCGDGKWSNYVAPCFVYDRHRKMWYVWVSSFAHEHILAYAEFESDVRFGVNVIDVRQMPPADETNDITDFVGFSGDEDPDIWYNEEENMWYMAICRMDKQYGYMFFKSQNPFEGYTFVGKGPAGSETGGVFVKTEAGVYFVCGNGWGEKSCYRVYSKDGMKHASFNYPDGGFRGWGGIFPVKCGTRTRTFWISFDRFRGSDYSWSYGNLYCFELE